MHTLLIHSVEWLSLNVMWDLLLFFTHFTSCMSRRRALSWKKYHVLITSKSNIINHRQWVKCHEIISFWLYDCFEDLRKGIIRIVLPEVTLITPYIQNIKFLKTLQISCVSNPKQHNKIPVIRVCQKKL